MGNLPIDSSAAALSLQAVALNLLVCAAISFVLSWHFSRFGSTFSNRAKFARVLPPIALTTMLVIMVVKSNLILSLGLVGALSIVRFRTPVKEPEELAYLFLSIALGLGMGADPKGLTVLPPGAREVTCLSVAIILAILTAVALARRGSRYPNLYLDIGVNRAPQDGQLLEDLVALVSRHSTRADLRRFDAQAHATQATFFVDCEDASKLAAIEGELRGRYEDVTVTFVEQSGLPGA